MEENIKKGLEQKTLKPRIMTMSSTLLIRLKFQGYICESVIFAWNVT